MLSWCIHYRFIASPALEGILSSLWLTRIETQQTPQPCAVSHRQGGILTTASVNRDTMKSTRLKSLYKASGSSITNSIERGVGEVWWGEAVDNLIISIPDKWSVLPLMSKILSPNPDACVPQLWHETQAPTREAHKDFYGDLKDTPRSRSLDWSLWAEILSEVKKVQGFEMCKTTSVADGEHWSIDDCISA